MERFEGMGTVPREVGEELGLKGPAARASGLDRVRFGDVLEPEDARRMIPPPKIVAAVGACAISGGPYLDHPEAHNGADAVVPVDL